MKYHSWSGNIISIFCKDTQSKVVCREGRRDSLMMMWQLRTMWDQRSRCKLGGRNLKKDDQHFLGLCDVDQWGQRFRLSAAKQS